MTRADGLISFRAALLLLSSRNGTLLEYQSGIVVHETTLFQKATNPNLVWLGQARSTAGANSLTGALAHSSHEVSSDRIILNRQWKQNHNAAEFATNKKHKHEFLGIRILPRGSVSSGRGLLPLEGGHAKCAFAALGRSSLGVVLSEDALEIQRVVGLTDAELKRIVSRVPQVNDYSSSAASTCVDKLKEKLSLSDLEFKKKLVLRLPQCLGYDFASEIDPSLSALQASLDMSGDELRSLVLKCPQIIGLDFSSEVEPKIAAIRNRLGGDDKSALKEEILKKPASLDLPVRGGASPSKKT